MNFVNFQKFRRSDGFRLFVGGLTAVLLSAWGAPSIAYANSPLLEGLPEPGTMVRLSPQFEPALIRGMRVYADNPLRFDFIIDVGQNGLQGEELTQETRRLIKYFLAALTVPEEEMWVNLSPYENDRIVPASFGITEMGRDMLAQDYILKQITASLMYPEDDVGKKFWDRVYAKAQQLFGTADIPVNTFNKVWIVPDKAVVYENGDTAYVVRSRLKVMLEEDYLATEASRKPNAAFRLETAKMNGDDVQSPEVTEIIREVMIPEIEKEVNEGEHFRPLRQIFNSMILATWFKRNLRESFLGRKYVDKKKVSGVDVQDRDVKKKIYQQYLKAFREGAYSYIKEEFDPITQEIIPRKYFSGGTSLALSDETFSVVRTLSRSDRATLSRTEDRLRIAPTSLQARSPRDAAILSERSYAELLVERFITEGISEQIQREEMAEYLRNYSFVARHSRETVEQTSPRVVALFDEFGITDKTQQSNILSIAQVLLDLQVNPQEVRQQALDTVRRQLNESPDELDEGELFEQLAVVFRLSENGLLLVNAGDDFAASEGLLRGQARSVVRTDPRYSGISYNGTRITNMPLSADRLGDVFGQGGLDAVIVNRRLGVTDPDNVSPSQSEIDGLVSQSALILNQFGQLIVIAAPAQAEAVMEAVRANPFTELSTVAGEQAVLISATKRDAAILTPSGETGFFAQPFREYQDIESMYANLPADIINTLRGIGRGLSAAEAAEVERAVPFAQQLLSGVQTLYESMTAENAQGEAVNLTTQNFHNHLHNMLVTRAGLIWNGSAGRITSSRDLKVAYLAGLLHDFHLRQILSPADESGRQWATPAYVEETEAQIGDLLGISTYARPVADSADYAGRIEEQFKEDFRRALRDFLGDELSLSEFFQEVVTAIRRTDYPSDVALSEVTYQELAGVFRYSLDYNIQQWLSGEQTYTDVLDNLAARWEIAFQRVEDDYTDAVYGEDARDGVREAALTYLRRRQSIDLRFLAALRNLPAERRAAVYQISNRLELADQSGSFWLTTAPVSTAIIQGLANELPFISEEGTYPFFIAQVVDTLRNRTMFEELPRPFKERYLQRVDELVQAAGQTVIPLRGQTAADYWAQERPFVVEQFGLEPTATTTDGVRDRAVLGDGRRMPQNPRQFTVSTGLRGQLIERYGEDMIVQLEQAGQLNNLYSLNENLRIVVEQVDRLYAENARKPDRPQMFIRGGIIRRFQAQDLSDLQPDTDLDIILADSDNYTVRDRLDGWFDNNRVQIMALPVAAREGLVEVDRDQLSESPSYLLDLWAGYAGITPGAPQGTRDQARLNVNPQPQDAVGGIDLNPTMLQIETEGQGIQIETPVDMQELESMPIEGFTPVIFQIVPVTNLPLLLGINDLEDPPDAPQDGTQLSALSGRNFP